MKTVVDSIAEARREVDDMIQTADACADCWTTPRAPGKWSPSQVVEHVARSFEASARDVSGVRSGFLNLPRFVRPLARSFLFNRVLRTGKFPKARTNGAMNPDRGLETPAAAAVRLESSWNQFSSACTQAYSSRAVATCLVFGVVPLVDYVRFQALHVRHHHGQLREQRARAVG
jgi:hypothetical protein